MDAMTSMPSPDRAPSDLIILKQDARGRVRVPRGRQEALVDEFERSGLSGIKFAAHCGVKYPTFAAWVQRRRRERGSDSVPPARKTGTVRWMEAVLPGPSASPLSVHLPGGVRMEIATAAQAPLAAAVWRAFADHHPRGGEEALC
jgi:hypothetical protein